MDNSRKSIRLTRRKMLVKLKHHVSCLKGRYAMNETRNNEIRNKPQKAGGDIVNTRIAQKQSQAATATFTMAAPMSILISSVQIPVDVASDFELSASALSPISLMSPMAISSMSMKAVSTPTAPASFIGHVFGTNFAVAEAAGANTTYVAGLACTPSAAKKHDRKNNWQQRPLSLCGSSG
jgi:hypothetical protein